MKQNLVLSEYDGDLIANPSLYRQLVGKLIYLTITRPNWSCAMHVFESIFCGQATHIPLRMQDTKCYDTSSSHQVKELSAANNIQLHAFCDVDWARC
jgi:hypothetical protein